VIDRPAPASSTAARELASRWPVVLGAILGVGLGTVALPQPAIGIFMHAMQAQFGWTRAEISTGPTILIGLLALTAPLVGWIADRIAPAWISGLSLAALAASFFLLSRVGPDVRLYYGAFVFMGATGCGAASLVYARVISSNFDHARGVALGLAMMGNGVTGIFLPMLLVPYAAQHGWRAGFLALGTLVALSAPFIALLLSRSRPAVHARPQTIDGALPPGKSLEEALRQPTFWVLVIAFSLIPLSLSGLSLHFVALLTDAGIGARQAGVLASLIGVAMIISRLASGWLLDRLPGPLVAASTMAISAACIASMGLFGALAAPFGAVAIGMALGSELDLVGYMTARYFGFRAYGRIYGLLYAACLVGGAISPIAVGLIADATHAYTVSLFGSAGLLLLSALFFLGIRLVRSERDTLY
jgi:nitrate/nitrite transporter NarK